MPRLSGRGPRAAEAVAGFTLDRMRLREGDRLEIVGRWTGIREEQVSDPVLVLTGGAGRERLPALPRSSTGSAGESGRWLATFPWNGGDLGSAQLEFSSGMVVDLPALHDVARRFGHQVLPVRQVTEEQPTTAERLRIHAELIEAQELAEAAREAQREASEEARRARVDAAHERDVRRAESSRMREALASVRRLAEEALETERAATRDMASALEEAQSALEAERAATAALRTAAAEADEQLAAVRRELQEVRGTIDAAGARAAEAAQAEQEARALAADADARAAALLAGNERLERTLAQIRHALGDVDAERPPRDA